MNFLKLLVLWKNNLKLQTNRNKKSMWPKKAKNPNLIWSFFKNKKGQKS